MNDHRTLFRYVIKALGVLFIGLSLPGLAIALETIYTTISLMYSPPVANAPAWQLYAYMNSALGNHVARILRATGPIAQFGFGVYLLFWGGLLFRWCALPSGARCPSCAYDLNGNTTEICPECGCNVSRLKTAPNKERQFEPCTSPGSGRQAPLDDPRDERHADETKHDSDESLQ